MEEGHCEINNSFLRFFPRSLQGTAHASAAWTRRGAIDAAFLRRVVGLTFCCRHSLHALFTPGCLFLSLLAASYPSSPLPGELWRSWTLFLFPFELTGLTGALLMLPALLWGRPNAGAGSTLIWCLEWRSRSEFPIAISEVCFGGFLDLARKFLGQTLQVKVLASSRYVINTSVWRILRA